MSLHSDFLKKNTQQYLLMYQFLNSKIMTYIIPLLYSITSRAICMSKLDWNCQFGGRFILSNVGKFSTIISKEVDIWSTEAYIPRITKSLYNSVFLLICFPWTNLVKLLTIHNILISKIFQVQRHHLIEETYLRKSYSWSCHEFVKILANYNR